VPGTVSILGKALAMVWWADMDPAIDSCWTLTVSETACEPTKAVVMDGSPTEEAMAF
jgi:hypothetical protein